MLNVFYFYVPTQPISPKISIACSDTCQQYLNDIATEIQVSNNLHYMPLTETDVINIYVTWNVYQFYNYPSYLLFCKLLILKSSGRTGFITIDMCISMLNVLVTDTNWDLIHSLVNHCWFILTSHRHSHMHMHTHRQLSV